MTRNSNKQFEQFSPRMVAKLKNYVYAFIELSEEGERVIYIGRGVGNRCFQHLQREDDKFEKLEELRRKNKLAIDILRHGLDNETAKVVEATCIDLLPTNDLENKIRGFGTNFGRWTLEEIRELYQDEPIVVAPNHAGLAFNLNKSYQQGMNEVELLEATRGTWYAVPRDPNLKYAYATYQGILGQPRLKKKWEFIGVIAKNEIRSRYKGKLIKLKRSFATPFQRVGC